MLKNTMKFIHVASYKDGFFNGIKSVLEELVPEQRALGHDVWILNHEYNGHELIAGEKCVKGIRDFIKSIEAIHPDFVIFHSLYGLDDVKFSYYLRYRHIPYMVEPHGGTSLENAKKNRIKKKIANFLYANNFIRHAAGLIYLNKKEKDECVFQRIRRNSSVIPNGTRIHGLIGKSRPANVVRFVFLARIDINQKGLDLLFPAIDEANRKGVMGKAEFHFYGKARNPQWGEMFDEYISKASRNVIYHGPANGREKERAFEDGDIFILTSRYEGMPMAVLEALSYGLPCMLTQQTNVTDIILIKNCGWVAETTIESISNSIVNAIEDFHKRRNELMNNSVDAAKMFEWKSIAANSIHEYARLTVPLASTK